MIHEYLYRPLFLEDISKNGKDHKKKIAPPKLLQG